MSQTKIMVFGTFDCLHPGHINFFEQARKLSKNAYLIVSIARDVNVRRIKGKLPENFEKERLNLINNCRLVDLVVMGDMANPTKHIFKIKPDIIALGYDQLAYTENLQDKLKAKLPRVKIVRLKPYKEKYFKSSKLKKDRLA